jgi:chromosome segregation ATPase
MTTPAIKAAASALAEVKQTTETAASTLAEAQASRAQVAERIVALEAERAAIASERKAGADKPDHGARLAIIGMDLEDLADMLAEADAAVAAARAGSQSAAGHVASAQRALDRETDTETLSRLVVHAEKVDGVLLGTIQEINAACGRLGRPAGREPWAPSIQLAEALQRRHLTREFRR